MKLSVFDANKSIYARVEQHDPDVSRKAIEMQEVIRLCKESMDAIEQCRVPVVAAIRGYWLGAGVEIAAACDIRYASANAKFTIREVEIGAVLDYGTLQKFDK